MAAENSLTINDVGNCFLLAQRSNPRRKWHDISCLMTEACDGRNVDRRAKLCAPMACLTNDLVEGRNRARACQISLTAEYVHVMFRPTWVLDQTAA